jgi:hypothetical protein
MSPTSWPGRRLHAYFAGFPKWLYLQVRSKGDESSSGCSSGLARTRRRGWRNDRPDQAIHRHLDLRADVYAAADQPSAAAAATTTTRQSLEADNLNLRASVRRQTQHIADLEARLSELLGEQAYSRTGLGAPRNHAALEEQNHTLQNEIEELRAKMQDQEEELGAAREANRQLIGQLNRPAPSDGLDGRRGTMQDATRQD